MFMIFREGFEWHKLKVMLNRKKTASNTFKLCAHRPPSPPSLTKFRAPNMICTVGMHIDTKLNYEEFFSLQFSSSTRMECKSYNKSFRKLVDAFFYLFISFDSDSFLSWDFWFFTMFCNFFRPYRDCSSVKIDNYWMSKISGVARYSILFIL